MNQPKPEQEPSMEEILASIRRIISEDGEEGDAPVDAPEPEAATPLEVVATDEAPEEEAAEVADAIDDDVLELTEVVAEQPLSEPAPEPDSLLEPEPAPEPETLFEPETMPEPEPEALLEPEPEPEAAIDLEFEEPAMDESPLDQEMSEPPAMEEPLAHAPADDDSLVADSTALMASAALSKLRETPADEASEGAASLPIGDKTIEALVRELMRPMLKEWLNQNLPGIVERIVEQEVKRVAERLHSD